ncbi:MULTISPECIES: heavy metal translocating P-type ATPase [Helicobacter]|uniref:P-type Zn(2+) transporter n=1 Tax=Helicobacter ibis TaxID=2962633 RepID=A0ABT4VED1_9HELI|nr:MULTISPECIES: heavy metal translocating P-type ATPase [Helicobacter]MDA3967493.1 heavy metal translocating P-type ATPase [Helicobacter sp. WB40]MDA3969067.1 heavy metal translocating P-type ATPase [Helicobacter ibis]
MYKNNEHALLLSIIHSTKSRARFKYVTLNGFKVNPLQLRVELDKIEGIYSVRVNSILNNIIVEYSGDLLEIQNRIYKVLSKQITISNKHNEESYIALRDEIPSSAEVVRAGTALISSSIVNNKPTQMGFSLIACFPLLFSGIRETMESGLTSRTLEAMAVAISLYLQDFKTANSTNFMLALGEYIEELTMYKSDDLIKELSKPTGGLAWVETRHDDEVSLIQVDSNELKVGDIVVIGAGDTILVDGHILEGEALVNQISMTGEATPCQKNRGDRVLSGTIVQEGKIKVWAEGVGEDTAMSKIKTYIEETLVQKSKRELEASKMADSLVPITLGLATLSYVFTKDLMRLASVLQADYSCALKLTTPVTFKAAISSAGKEGIIIKGAKSLEALQMSEVFIFDKTGTLTNGDLEVLSVHSFSQEFSSDEILNLAASIEEHYFHPVAQAIVKAAKAKDFTHIHHDEVTFIVAHGVKSEIGGKEVIIGSRHFLEDDEKIPFAPHSIRMNEILKDGDTPLFIGYDGELLGVILLKDVLRDNAKVALDRLRASGVKEIIMLTGDTKQKAQEVADILGINRFYAELLPTQKAEILEDIMKEGKKVAFVGDGINDAPALIKADTGIGMCKGADIAKASADVVLLRDDVESVADARELAIMCLNKVKRSFKITVGVNSLILGLASLGKLTAIQTAFAHNGTTIALLLNALQRIKVKR